MLELKGNAIVNHEGESYGSILYPDEGCVVIVFDTCGRPISSKELTNLINILRSIEGSI